MLLINDTRDFAATLLLCALLAACGNSPDLSPLDVTAAPTPPATTPAPATPITTTDQGKALGSYLHDLSPKLPGVTAGSATLEQYSIPVTDGKGGTIKLDGWIQRPPGTAGQPLVLVLTPYYGGGSPALSPALGYPSKVFATYLVPYGYAVGFVSLPGTGNSQGCFHIGGAIERQQVYDAVEWLAHRPWSNGAVGAIGVSYPGTTPNELFVHPPPSIKTVVPMEGLTDFYRYSFTTGAIPRSGGVPFGNYYNAYLSAPAGLEGGEGVTDPATYASAEPTKVCEETLAEQRASAESGVTADKTAYYQDRDAVALVNKSLGLPRPPMFFIQGYQDGNVEPLMADAYLDAVRKTGVPLHVWLGQWVHNYPQDGYGGSCAAKGPCRGDFFEKFLLAWFDQWLKGKNTGVLDAPPVQTQADDNLWRHEERWPPETTATAFYPQANGSLGLAPGAGTASYRDNGGSRQDQAVPFTSYYVPVPVPQPPGATVEFVSAPLTKPLRLTGLPHLATVATSDGARANLVATLEERKADGTQRYLNFATLDLGHAKSMETGDSNITGKALPVSINFYPQDNVVAAGSRLVLFLAGDIDSRTHTSVGNAVNLFNVGPVLSPLVSVEAQVTLDLSKTVLTLPVNQGNRLETLSWLTPSTP